MAKYQFGNEKSEKSEKSGKSEKSEKVEKVRSSLEGILSWVECNHKGEAQGKWSRGYGVIEGGKLGVYSSFGSLKPLFLLDLLLFSIKTVPQKESDKFCLHLLSPTKQFLLSFLDSSSQLQWLTLISKGISTQLDNSPSSSSSSSRSSSLSKEYSENLKEEEASNPFQDESHPLFQVRTNPSNCFCADCSSKDPTWASINCKILKTYLTTFPFLSNFHSQIQLFFKSGDSGLYRVQWSSQVTWSSHFPSEELHT